MTSRGSFSRLLDKQLAEREAARLLRRRETMRALDATHVQVDGRVLVNFCGNDYLGLSHHPRVVEALSQADAAGAGASGLISGYTPELAAAEAAIAAWKNTEAALLLPSGYQANHAAVQTLSAVTQGRARFLLDKLAHASLVDAVRGSGAEFRVFPHNHLRKLRRLLDGAQSRQMQVVVTESIFSMDGDAADLHGLAELKQSHEFLLLLDEAHGGGVYGRAGAGYADEVGLSGLADVSIATLSKAAGCMGGAICASRQFCDAVVNFGRAYIYSTAFSPALARAIVAALAVMRAEPQRQARVRELARRVRQTLSLAATDSPIIPIILGDAEAALAAAGKLRQAGLLVLAVRPPTVPPGTSRLRVTLSSQHSDDEVARLCAAIAGVCVGG